MNAALLMMTSTFMVGADAPAAAAPAAPAPAIVAGCGAAGCGTCDPCACKPTLLDKIKAKLACHKSCAPAPTCCAPAPTCAPVHHAPKCCAPAPTCAAPCDPCATARPNLLDKLKAKFHKKDCCAPACDGCAAGPAIVPAAPPKDMPKTMDPKKSNTGADSAPSITIPTPGATLTPAIPVTPVSGPKLTGASSPY